MSLTVVKGLQSEIFVPITPPSVWTPVTKAIKRNENCFCNCCWCSFKDQTRDLI